MAKVNEKINGSIVLPSLSETSRKETFATKDKTFVFVQTLSYLVTLLFSVACIFPFVLTLQ